MNRIFASFILISLVFSIFSGTTGAVSSAVLQGASSGVTLAISLAGPLCLWSGLARVMTDAGWLDRLARLLTPLLRRLFPQAWQNRQTREAICGNLSANLLGLGNAATPLGIRAVGQMSLGLEGQASNELCRLVILNTASIQLIPSTVAAIRSSLGASSPFDILPAVWITSICSVAVGLTAAKVLERWM